VCIRARDGMCESYMYDRGRPQLRTPKHGDNPRASRIGFSVSLTGRGWGPIGGACDVDRLGSGGSCHLDSACPDPSADGEGALTETTNAEWAMLHFCRASPNIQRMAVTIAGLWLAGCHNSPPRHFQNYSARRARVGAGWCTAGYEHIFTLPYLLTSLYLYS
jgi:hypothetical protein